MGYAKTFQYQQITVKSALNTGKTILNGAADYDLNADIVTPVFTDPLTYAYLDLHIANTKDTSAADNYLDTSGSFGLKDTSAVYHAAQNINQGYLYTYASSVMYGYILTSTNNLASYISSNSSHRVFLKDWSAHADTLICRSIYGELRMYFST